MVLQNLLTLENTEVLDRSVSLLFLSLIDLKTGLWNDVAIECPYELPRLKLLHF